MKQLSLCLAFLVSFAAYANQAQVLVNGMVCAFCAQGITKKFKAEKAVQKVDVSLEKKLVTIDFKDGQDIPNSRIESILKDAGYSVEKIERK